MRIAQVAPLYESVPPKYYGGTERVVSYLTEELVRQGHEVTLFASGDSETNARLVATCRRSLRWINVTRARWPTISLCWNVFSSERASSTSFIFMSITCISRSVEGRRLPT